MSDLGKVDHEFFDTYSYPHFGADRDDVRLGSQHGVDFGGVDDVLAALDGERIDHPECGPLRDSFEEYLRKLEGEA